MDNRRAGKALALLALIGGENQTARSKNADVAVTTVRGAYGEWAKAPVAP